MSSVVTVGDQIYLSSSSGTNIPLLFWGTDVTVNQFAPWVPVAEATTANGYEVAWQYAGEEVFGIWNMNSSGQVTSYNLYGGSEPALEQDEILFQKDLNGDGTVGPVTTVYQSQASGTTVIGTDGSTSLTQVGDDYFLYNGKGQGPALKLNGVDVVAGQFGPGWAPIGAVATAGGYDVAWQYSGSALFSIWTTDSNGNVVSYNRNIGTGAEADYALESAETTFGQDLNGDGVIGPTKTVIATDGKTSLTQLADEYFLYNGAGTGPVLQWSGFPVFTNEFAGGWMPIGAVQKPRGAYDVAWELPGTTNYYSVWRVNKQGDYLSNIVSDVPGNNRRLERLESVFNQDFNSGGVAGIYAAPSAAPIGAGATLELSAATSASVTFESSTGSLLLTDAPAFTGEIFNFTGNGTLSGSDQIDLRDISFASVGDHYSNGVLTVTDGTNTAELDFNGTYSLANFKLVSDGADGTIVYDPPAANPAPITQVIKATGGATTISTDANVELHAVNSGSIDFTGSGGALVLDNPATFTGTVSGFNSQNMIDLPGIAFGAQTSLGYSPNSNGSGGTLSVTDGAHAAQIALLGSYMASSFVLESDNHGGAMVLAGSPQVIDSSVLAHPAHA